MQRPSDQKRDAIFKAAARLFATCPFHEVRLEDIAADAHVGKGTLYVYFESKEALYLTLVRDGFRNLVSGLQQELSEGPACTRERVQIVIAGLVRFAFTFPDLYRVMRTRILTPEDHELQAARRELTQLIESILREGIERQEISDRHPEITAQFILSFVRGALLYPPEGLTPEILRDHVLRVLWHGIGRKVERSVSPAVGRRGDGTEA